MIKHQTALVITGTIKAASRDRLYQQIILKSLTDSTWSCKISVFQKIVIRLLPSYLQSDLNNYNHGVEPNSFSMLNKTLSGRGTPLLPCMAPNVWN